VAPTAAIAILHEAVSGSLRDIDRIAHNALLADFPKWRSNRSTHPSYVARVFGAVPRSSNASVKLFLSCGFIAMIRSPAPDIERLGFRGSATPSPAAMQAATTTQSPAFSLQ
jgi:hypothetical protein